MLKKFFKRGADEPKDAAASEETPAKAPKKAPKVSKPSSKGGKPFKLSGDPNKQYAALQKKGLPIPPELSLARGDILRDLGNSQEAISFYEEAATSYAKNEMWEHVESVLNRTERMVGRPTVASMLLWLQVHLGREDYPEARKILQALSTVLLPSDGMRIEQMILIVDNDTLVESDVEVTLAETLITLARPERALERLKRARMRAQQERRSDRIEKIDARIAQFSTVSSDSLSTMPTLRKAPAESRRAEPQMRPEREVPTPVVEKEEEDDGIFFAPVEETKIVPQPVERPVAQAPIEPPKTQSQAEPVSKGDASSPSPLPEQKSSLDPSWIDLDSPLDISIPSEKKSEEQKTNNKPATEKKSEDIFGSLPPLPPLGGEEKEKDDAQPHVDQLGWGMALPPLDLPEIGAGSDAPFNLDEIALPTTWQQEEEREQEEEEREEREDRATEEAKGVEEALEEIRSHSPESDTPSVLEDPFVAAPTEIAPEQFEVIEPTPAKYIDPADLLREEAQMGSTRFVGEDPTKKAQSDDEQIQHLVRKLREGLREVVPEGEANSHYHLGLNFMTMELWDEAVESLQTAFRAPAFRGRAAEALAESFLERGNAVLARGTIRIALEGFGEDDRPPLGLWYWQGRASEELGNREEARDAYERVAIYDTRFRDVVERLRTLS